MIPKFRAWDKLTDTIQDVLDINFLEKTVTVSQKDIVWYKHDNLRPFKGVILMQSTGLKDKNGVEIFEGDIVAFEDSDGGYEYQDIVINTGIVEYGELGFYFTNRVAVDMDDFYIKDGRCDDVEVIGNIYENPELLSSGIE